MTLMGSAPLAWGSSWGKGCSRSAGGPPSQGVPLVPGTAHPRQEPHLPSSPSLTCGALPAGAAGPPRMHFLLLIHWGCPSKR